MGEQRAKKITEEEALKEAENTLNQLKEKKADEDTAESKKEDGKKVAKKSVKGPKYRSKKYQTVKSQVDRKKIYPIDEAIDLVKKTSYSKFEGTVELHIRLDQTKKKEAVRGLVQLPHSIGKEVKVGIIDDKMIEEILKDKKTNYDILLASPEMMPKIARIAKILGPQGKMPNPKSGTVTSDPQKSIEEIKKGKMEFKADKQGIIHLAIGKTSWDAGKVKDNFKMITNSLQGQKLQSITICATMGPGIKVAL